MVSEGLIEKLTFDKDPEEMRNEPCCTHVGEMGGGGRVVAWAWGARDAPETLFLCSATLGESLIPLTLFPHLRKEGKGEG